MKQNIIIAKELLKIACEIVEQEKKIASHSLFENLFGGLQKKKEQALEKKHKLQQEIKDKNELNDFYKKITNDKSNKDISDSYDELKQLLEKSKKSLDFISKYMKISINDILNKNKQLRLINKWNKQKIPTSYVFSYIIHSIRDGKHPENSIGEFFKNIFPNFNDFNFQFYKDYKLIEGYLKDIQIVHEFSDQIINHMQDKKCDQLVKKILDDNNSSSLAKYYNELEEINVDDLQNFRNKYEEQKKNEYRLNQLQQQIQDELNEIQKQNSGPQIILKKPKSFYD